MEPKKIFLTVNQFCEEYKWPTQSGLRWMIFKKEQNGFKTAFIKVGRRVLIDVNEFWNCVEKKGEK